MVEMKYALFMFFWPVPGAEEPPQWTVEFYESYDECQAGAPSIADQVREKYGKDVKIDYQCISKDAEVKL